MKKKTLLLAGLSLVIVGGGAGTWWWVEAGGRQAAIATALPPIPDLSAVVEPLRERIAGADARALSRFSAQAGLAELSRLYHANGFLAEALRCYEALERLDPGEPRWPHRRATILAGYGEVEPALTLWRRTAVLAPDYIPALLRIGDCELKSNRPAKAVEAYAHVLTLVPDEPHAQLGLARVDFEAGRWEEARTRLEPLVQRTNYQLGYDLIVSVYERLGQRELAETIRGSTKAFGAYRDPDDPWVDELMAECYDPYRLSLTAGVLARLGSSEAALNLLERAVSLAPQDISARFQLGLLEIQRGNLQQAREHLQGCTILDPKFADAWAHLSSVYGKLGQHAAAEDTLQTGLKYCPESPGLHLMRARNLKAAKRNEEALQEFAIAGRFRPNEPEAFAEQGSLLIAMGRTEEGIASMRRALETDPGEPTVLTVLAMNAIVSGNSAEADDWLRRITHQPRVPSDRVARLLQAYREQFGREWQR